MKRFMVYMSNGYCGCDNQYIMSFDDNASPDEIWEAIFSAYDYAGGFAGMENCMEEEENYEDRVADYSYWQDLTEEKYNKLIEEGYEERFY